MKPPHIHIFEGKKPGPYTVILGSVHGNERVGKGVIDALIALCDEKTLCGTLVLIVGNPEAYAADVRFLDVDLNRQFTMSHKSERDHKSVLNREEQRAKEIAPFLEKADYVLDIHSTSKPSVPFVYTETTAAHMKLAMLLKTQYIVSAHPDFRPSELVSSTDSYVDHHGGIGLTYEAGWNKNPLATKDVLTQTLHFLNAVGTLESGAKNPETLHPPKWLQIEGHVLPKTSEFHFLQDFKNFDAVEAGEWVASDGKTIVKAPHSGYLVFPKLNFSIGSSAVYFAQEHPFHF